MFTRREFLRTSAAAGAAGVAQPLSLDALAAAGAPMAQQSPDEVAVIEPFWREVRQAFDLDPTLINLNNGNSSPSPRTVHAAFKRHLDDTNRLPVHYRTLIEQRLDEVRRDLAGEFGCDPAELAMTRNATEALHIAQLGIELRPGDEIITTDQDYPRMLWAWDQRARREGIVVKRIQFPVPATAADLLERFERAITARTRVMQFCHLTDTTGQLFPVRELSRLARSRGIISIVDGAQAVGHVPLRLRDLECDLYGTSLHKWLMAPHGTGFLYVRRDTIERVWPLFAASDSLRADVRKFEEIGTHPAAARAAIADALTFHRAVGAERKVARLRYLTMRWVNGLRSRPQVRILSSLEPGETWGLATFAIQGINAATVVPLMQEKHGIVVSSAVNQGLPGPVLDYSGVRVTPNIYTSIEEIDRFVAAVRELL
jgi:selenocysteine lyase/cysteine desulfurase